MIEAWTGQYNPQEGWKFLFIDVFGGYGSVTRHVKSLREDVYTYTNDINTHDDNDIELNVNDFGCSSIIMFALNKHFEFDLLHSGQLVQFLIREKIAVLMHLSTPCRTYKKASPTRGTDSKCQNTHSYGGFTCCADIPWMVWECTEMGTFL